MLPECLWHASQTLTPTQGMKQRRIGLHIGTARKHALWLVLILSSLLGSCSCEEGGQSQDAARYHLMSYDTQDLTSKVTPRRFATVVLR